jgi:hypothetical protein
VSEPFVQCLGGVVDEPDLIGLGQGGIGHGDCGRPPGTLTHEVGGALQVGHIHRAQHVDPRVPQRPDGREMPAVVVDEHDGWPAREHRVEVQIPAAAGTVAGGTPRRDHLQAPGCLGRPGPAVGVREPDDHVLALVA